MELGRSLSVLLMWRVPGVLTHHQAHFHHLASGGRNWVWSLYGEKYLVTAFCAIQKSVPLMCLWAHLLGQAHDPHICLFGLVVWITDKVIELTGFAADDALFGNLMEAIGKGGHVEKFIIEAHYVHDFSYNEVVDWMKTHWRWTALDEIEHLLAQMKLCKTVLKAPKARSPR